MKDRIVLKGIKLRGRIGVTEEEKHHDQLYVVGIAIEADLKPVAVSDELKDTIDYSMVMKFAQDLMDEMQCELLEKYADELAKAILETHRLADSVRVSIEKPDAPIAGEFESVGVEIEYRRHG